MIRWGKSILVALAAVVAVPVYADMMPVLPAEVHLPVSGAVDAQTYLQEVDLPGPCLYPTDAKFLSAVFGAEVADRTASVDTPQPVTVLVDYQNSMTLCLYALMGLGLCKSATWMRKFTLGVIPEWYHDGGPVQIGHSFVVLPDCRCSVLMCFFQPDGGAADPVSEYNQRAQVVVWQVSQFTPVVLPARGPPRFLNESVALVKEEV